MVQSLFTAGSDELLTMKLRKDSFGNTTTSAGIIQSSNCTYARCYILPTATVSPAMIVARMKRLLDNNKLIHKVDGLL